VSKNDKKLKYDAWLNWAVVSRCNLNCEYCFFHNNLSKKFGKTSKIDIPALIQTLDKTDKVFWINFTGGGEPFLTPNIVEACIEITKKHYISFNTNLTSTNIREFAEKINPKKVRYIFASLHIKELEKLGLMDRYVNNYLMCREKGFHIDAIEIAYPSMLNEVKKYKEFFKRKKIDIKFFPFIGEYKNKKYPESYTTEEIKMFGLEKSKNIFNHRGEFCNAGYNAGTVLTNGDIIRCFSIPEKLGNVYKEIKFKEKLIRCPMEFCGCPMKSFDKSLFAKALKETKNTKNKR
jgi:MoaA/NifB/PqqE/SkfB family radical SAM enzyme